MLIKGPASPLLCNKLDKTGLKTAEVQTKVFPDEEVYVKVKGKVEGEDCFLVQTTYPNQHLLELFMIQNALKENGARSIKVIVPYYSYGRQDQIFEKGEAISAKAFAQRISIDADEFYSVDLHSEDIVDFFEIPAENISAMTRLAEYSTEKKNPDLLIAPDEGAKEMVENAALNLGLECDYLEKTRIDANTVEIKPKNIDVKGKSVVILDDIIATGGTMTEAAKQLKGSGAEEVHAGCTHGLFVGDAKKNLDAVCDSVFCTDTIEQEKSEVSVAPLLTDLIE
ncbi:MAG: ribose-phosphate diphosphokinase [Candidatus Thermoplasmatota archaeon]|nr:ribose-phosphate diphosphokinase [Candidatus Thermoplasmatota archaeon]MBS3789708.1 ribose-phosphate diphosphokinase [Candidatus Thermoplasmatota archaeon]